MSVKRLIATLFVLLVFSTPWLPSRAAEPKPETSKKEQRAWRKERLAALPEKHRAWLEDVDFIISDDERDMFLSLEKDYQRDAFIERFWKVRDNYSDTGRNEFRDSYQNRLLEAKQLFGKKHDDRAKVLLTNGYPAARLEIRCSGIVPSEVWYYDGSDTVRFEFYLLFYQRDGLGTFRIWELVDGLDELSSERIALSLSEIERRCSHESYTALAAAIGFQRAQGGILGSMSIMNRINSKPPVPQKEWIATFETYSTDLPPDAVTFDAEIDLLFPSRNQNRTVVQGNVVVKKADLAPVVLGPSQTYNLQLAGEVLKDGQLFDSFRYRFDFPLDPEILTLPLLFERSLRAGSYQLVIKVEDLGSGKLFRQEKALEVPSVEMPPPAMDSETARLLAEANAAIASGETTIKIPKMIGGWQTGMVRIEAASTGPKIDHVTFFLDDASVLTKKSPPWNVELDLGKTPRSRILRIEAFDAAGQTLASDQVTLNAGDHRFGVRLVEPHRGRRYSSSLRAQAEVILPKGDVVERVEFYLNDTKLAALFQPPWVLPISLPAGEEIAYVQAKAFRPDGSSAEDLVFVNAPDNLEEVEVDFVELYTLVLDKNKRPLQGLTEPDFQVFEDGVPQKISKFELVENLPIHTTVMLDVSASMTEELDLTREAALRFFEQTVTPKDRAAVITFNDHPTLTTPFTNDTTALAGGLAALKAERGTALYDALIFNLYYFNGIGGQKALLLLSDGKDESSRFSFDEALEYARRSQVALYSIGLKIPRTEIEARRKLNKLAEETGGRSFFAESGAELGPIYEAIQKELRSRYLIAYQSSNQSPSKAFRTIEVKTKSGLEAATLRGYYP